ncbi:MAG: diacylglycerol kinase family lipid kinase [Eubacteriales bacterium]|nr:diacylglycerol kinase family lipid kinase [Eubacteriales bacterium]
MKHIFILNPVAGKGRAEIEVLPKVLEAVKDEGIDYEIHRTINVSDATNYVKNRCMAGNGEPMRFYAIGGDGTLNEVVNGAYGFDNAEVAFIPAGTGNDFVRVFKNPQFFKDIKRQLGGKAKTIDLIRHNDRVFINVLNIGLDCQVVAEVVHLKKKPFLRGALAYGVGVAIAFTGNRGCDLTITMEDGRTHQGEITLVAVGNGAFYGGGFKGIPRAKIDDGLLDVSIIKKVNRRTFLSLVMDYRKGTHLEKRNAKDLIHYTQCKSLTIHSHKEMQICIDGELAEAEEIAISIVPGALRFSVPDGCE